MRKILFHGSGQAVAAPPAVIYEFVQGRPPRRRRSSEAALTPRKW